MPVSDVKFDRADPRPAALIQSMRAFGYDLPTAVADIIDNSITAGAKHIWVHGEWNGEASSLSIIDDGSGMTADELVEALRPGSASPLGERDPKDLGRFGLGLKTASFSQATKLTVASKSSQGIVTRMWDLDYVGETGEWRLLRTNSEAMDLLIPRLEKLKTGTIVLWENLDRLPGVLDSDDSDHFLAHLDRVRDHLAAVFHRFLSTPSPLKMYLNGREIIPWDPFMEQNKSTRILPEEKIQFAGSEITVRPYVVPHVSKLSQEDRRVGGGIKRWNAQQGFYVYRNKRLLVGGDWLGLGFVKEEHYKLARIRLDIPNSMDAQWSLDVKKSRATPPAPLKPDLRRIAEATRKEASEVYRHRAARGAQQQVAFSLVWERSGSSENGFEYKINRDHPLIAEMLADKERGNEINRLLKLIEGTVPVPLITMDGLENPNADATREWPTERKRAVASLAKEFIEFKTENGFTRAEAIHEMATCEPFERYPEIIEALKDES
jgi:hypothetical protein